MLLAGGLLDDERMRHGFGADRFDHPGAQLDQPVGFQVTQVIGGMYGLVQRCLLLAMKRPLFALVPARN